MPVSDARAQYALTLETSDPVHIGKTTLHRARCVSWVTLRAADGADGLELLRTQGRVGGSIEIEEEGERRATKPFVSALDLHARDALRYPA